MKFLVKVFYLYVKIICKIKNYCFGYCHRNAYGAQRGSFPVPRWTNTSMLGCTWLYFQQKCSCKKKLNIFMFNLSFFHTHAREESTEKYSTYWNTPATDYSIILKEFPQNNDKISTNKINIKFSNIILNWPFWIGV